MNNQVYPQLLGEEMLRRAVRQRMQQLQQGLLASQPPGSYGVRRVSALPYAGGSPRRLPPQLNSYMPLPRY